VVICFNVSSHNYDLEVRKVGILNGLMKAGCNHDWGYWQRYDPRDNNVNTLKSFALNPDRLKSCYEVRRCSKCRGYETRWVHDWRVDQKSVDAQREWERTHSGMSTEYQGPGIMMECARCGKRDPQFVVMGD